MLSSHRTFAWAFVCCLLVLALANEVSAQEPAAHREPGENAALYYWQALAVLPNHPRGTEWEVAAQTPLTCTLQDAEFLFDGASSDGLARHALKLLRDGSTRPYCVWQQGPVGLNQYLFQTQRSPTAVGLLALSARLAISRGNVDQACDDLIAAWTFCAHLSNHGVTSWNTANYHVEHTLIPLTCRVAPLLGSPGSFRFVERLESQAKLPLPSLVDYGEIWLKGLEDAADADELQAVIRRLPTNASVSTADLASHAANAEQLASSTLETRKLLTEAERIANLPYKQFPEAARSFQDGIADASPIARSILGTSGFFGEPVMELPRKAARTAAKIAGIQYFLYSRGGGDVPYGILANANVHGIESVGNLRHAEMKIKLIGEEEPLELIFGAEALPEADEESRLFIYDPEADPERQIADALLRAKQEDKLVLLKWGFNGCAPCYRVHRLMEESTTIRQLTDEHYVIVPMDITNDQAGEIARGRYEFTPGLPHFTLLSPEGEMLAGVKPTETLYVQGSPSAELIQDFLAELVEQKEEDGK